MKPDFWWDGADPRITPCLCFSSLEEVVKQLAAIGLTPRGGWYPTPFFCAMSAKSNGGYVWSLPFLPVGLPISGPYQDNYDPLGGTVRTQKKPPITAAQLRKQFPAKRVAFTQPRDPDRMALMRFLESRRVYSNTPPHRKPQ